MTAVLGEARRDLASLGSLPDEAIDLAEAALALSALDHPRRDRQRYRSLLAEVTASVADRAATVDDAAERASRLAEVLVGQYRLVGDEDEGEGSADSLMDLLDRRRGSSPVLALVWAHVGRRMGWTVEALAFPVRSLLRLAGNDGQRVIVDPLAAGTCLNVADLRQLLKLSTGAEAELLPTHYTAESNREVLVRLQTAAKLRHLRHGQLQKALQTVEATLLFAPDQIGLWREAGLMHVRQGNIRGAIACLEQFVALAPNSPARHRTSALLQDLRKKLT